MLSNKKVNLIISLLVAIVLWGYVVGEINPEISKTFRDLPINYLNEGQLAEKGMAVASISNEKVNITVKGERSRINKMDNGDVVPSVDLSDAAKGDNEYKIGVKVPDNVTVENRSVSKVVVKIETLISEKRDVRVSYSGAFNEGNEGITLSNDTETVQISGAKSNVEKVKYVRAQINSEKLGNTAASFKVELLPVDSAGKVVEHISLDVNTAEISAVLGKTKDVELEVPVIGQDSGVKEKSVSAPKSITIKGLASTVDGISKITAESIDVSGITETTNVDIIPILPEGVEISDKSKKLKATVNVIELESKSFSYENDEIKIVGTENGHIGKVTGKVGITVSGKKKQLNAISKGDIELTVDLSGLGTGTHSVEVKASLRKEHSSLILDPTYVTVEIE
ncbi:MAG: CdaR family protein [Peptostreptococcaceae bacterium]|nr:CdaR family protein [Peptostreptococcaceae bacterium]MDY5739461.1 CdaR family protein [Anaerovoracaceae bacterium]